MVDEIGDKKKKIGSVGGTKGTSGVEKTGSIGEVSEVQKADAITGSSAAGSTGSRRPTRIMSAAERDALFKLIDEEAEKMFGNSELSEEHKQVARDAVKMAVDAATIEEDD